MFAENLQRSISTYASLHDHDKHISKLMHDCYNDLESKHQVLRCHVLINNVCHLPDKNILRVSLKLDNSSTLIAGNSKQVAKITADGAERSCALRACTEALVISGKLTAALQERGFAERVSLQLSSSPNVTYFTKSELLGATLNHKHLEAGRQL